MAMRASVVLFGHLGMEMDFRELSDEESVDATWYAIASIDSAK